MRRRTSARARAPSGRALIALGALSAAMLAFEVLLTRLLAIAHWHHFTGLVVSLALLGLSSAGTMLALGLARRVTDPALWLGSGAGCFALTAPACVGLAQRIPFNALSLGFEPWQVGWLALVYAVLAVPFLFAGLAIGGAIACWRGAVSQVYAVDLVGAGAGSLAAVLALLALPPDRALDASAALAAGAAALSVAGPGRARRAGAAAAVLAGVALATGLASAWTGQRVSEFKGLPRALAASGARVIASASGPSSKLDAVVNDRAPYRVAAGLSLVSPVTPPAQIAVYRDADEMVPVDPFAAGGPVPAYLQHVTSAAVYRLVEPSAVAVLEPGGGQLVLQALGAGAGHVLAVEPDRDLVRFLRGPLAGATAGWTAAPDVELLFGDPRAELARRPDRFDVVTLATHGGPGAIGQALAPSRLLTTGGLEVALRSLRRDGVLSMTIWNHVPPRTGPRLFATSVAALRALGVAAPAQHVAWLGGWSNATVLVSRSPLEPARVGALRAFADEHQLDLAWVPGLAKIETNRFNALAPPTPFEIATALLGPGAGAFTRAYKFDVRPATDLRPYPYAFARWRHLPELLRLRTTGGAGLLDPGLMVLAASLAVALVAGSTLALAPMLGRSRGRCAPIALVIGYFAAIGLGFIAVEMAVVHTLASLIGMPAVAFALVLCALLTLAGAGSAAHGRWFRSGSRAPGVLCAIAVACALSGACLPLATRALDGALGWLPLVTVVLCAAALSVALGIPFPAGIAALGRPGSAGDVGWAWAVNGAASVVGAVAGTLVAVLWGYSALLTVAAAAYGAAAAIYWQSARRRR